MVSKKVSDRVLEAENNISSLVRIRMSELARDPLFMRVVDRELMTLVDTPAYITSLQASLKKSLHI